MCIHDQVAAHRKQTQYRKSSICQYKIKIQLKNTTMTTTTKKKKRKKEGKKSVLYAHQPSLNWTGITCMEPEQSWVPVLDCPGSWAGCASKSTPLAPGVPGPLCMGPQSPDTGGPSNSYTKPSAPKGRWTLWAAIVSLGLTSPGERFPPPASFL